MQYRTEPYAHQEKALERGFPLVEFAYLMEMGTGKTKVLIDDACNHFIAGDITGLLVLAPKGVYENWLREVEVHSSVDMFVVTWKNYQTVTLTRSLERVSSPDQGKLSVLLVNIESLSKLKGRCAKAIEKFLFGHSRKVMMVVDESTKIKSDTAVRSKEIVRLSGFANWRRILTGSPVTNSPLDLFQQCKFLHPKLLGEPSIFTFRRRYCIVEEVELRPDDHGVRRKFPMIVGYRHLEELHDKLQTFSYRVTKDECLDLPPKTYVTRAVELTDQQVQLYEDMRKKCVAVVEGQLVTAPIALTQVLRLHQIVCGMVKDDDGVLHRVDNNRVNGLMDALEETSGKAIIWASFVQNIVDIQDRIAKTFGPESVVTYYGGTAMADRQTAIDRFQNDPTCRFFLSNQDTGGYGITLTAANTVFYYSNTYSLEKRLQSEDRAHRIGQRNPVLYVDFIAKGTVDEQVVKALLEKFDVARQITGDVLREWLTV